MKEAVVKFESEAAASTACLLNNALIDGANIKVELFPVEEKTTPTRSSPQQSETATNDSFTSIFSGLAASGMAFASAVGCKVKEIDQQYAISDSVVAGASTAWTESKKFASTIDNKYHIKDSVSGAAQTTKEHVMSAAGSFGVKKSSSKSPQSTSPRATPPSSPRQTSSSPQPQSF